MKLSPKCAARRLVSGKLRFFALNSWFCGPIQSDQKVQFRVGFCFFGLGFNFESKFELWIFAKKRARFSQLLVRRFKRKFRQSAQRGVFFGVNCGFLTYPVVFAALYKTTKKYSSVFDQG